MIWDFFFYKICSKSVNAEATRSRIQGVFEMRAHILITSYWLHVELGKNI
jgi:hypothetical protein